MLAGYDQVCGLCAGRGISAEPDGPHNCAARTDRQGFVSLQRYSPLMVPATQ